MYMTEKYRSYGTPPREIVSPLQITSVLATAVMLLGGACLGFLHLEKHPLHSLSAMIWLLIIYLFAFDNLDINLFTRFINHLYH